MKLFGRKPAFDLGGVSYKTTYVEVKRGGAGVLGDISQQRYQFMRIFRKKSKHDIASYMMTFEKLQLLNSGTEAVL